VANSAAAAAAVAGDVAVAAARDVGATGQPHDEAQNGQTSEQSAHGLHPFLGGSAVGQLTVATAAGGGGLARPPRSRTAPRDRNSGRRAKTGQQPARRRPTARWLPGGTTGADEQARAPP